MIVKTGCGTDGLFYSTNPQYRCCISAGVNTLDCISASTRRHVTHGRLATVFWTEESSNSDRGTALRSPRDVDCKLYPLCGQHSVWARAKCWSSSGFNFHHFSIMTAHWALWALWAVSAPVIATPRLVCGDTGQEIAAVCSPYIHPMSDVW